jgi:hypothetical protein
MISEKPTFLTKITGYTIIGAAIIGIVLSGWGLISIWRIKSPFTTRAQADLALVQSTLIATQDGVTAAGKTLETTKESVDSLVGILEAVGKSIEDTTPVIETLSRVVDADLPAAILSTRRSVLAAQSSARLIDDILGSLTSIPLFNLNRYAPQVPLNVALGEVAGNLSELPAALYEMEAGMAATRRNLTLIEIQVADIAYQVSLLNRSLDDASAVISSYDTILNELVDRTVYIQTNLDRWVNSAITILTIILIWVAVTQVGLITQGVFLIRGGPKAVTTTAEENTPTVEGK